MKDKRKATRIAGVLFIVALLASLIGGGLIETAKEQPKLIAGVIMEIVNAVAVLGIGILLFSVLKQFSENAVYAYLGFRIIESLACFSASFVVLTGSTELRVFHSGILIPSFFCGGALIFYTILFRYRLLPRFIAIWGLVGVLLIIFLNVFKPEGQTGLMLALPIVLNEILLGIWLISRGLKIDQ